MKAKTKTHQRKSITTSAAIERRLGMPMPTYKAGTTDPALQAELALASPIVRACFEHRMAYLEWMRALETRDLLDGLETDGGTVQQQRERAQKAEHETSHAFFDSQWRLFSAIPESWDDLEHLQSHIATFAKDQDEPFPDVCWVIPDFVLETLPELAEMVDGPESDAWFAAYRVYMRKAIAFLRYLHFPPGMNDTDRSLYERGETSWKYRPGS